MELKYCLFQSVLDTVAPNNESQTLIKSLKEKISEKLNSEPSTGQYVNSNKNAFVKKTIFLDV